MDILKKYVKYFGAANWKYSKVDENGVSCFYDYLLSNVSRKLQFVEIESGEFFTNVDVERIQLEILRIFSRCSSIETLLLDFDIVQREREIQTIIHGLKGACVVTLYFVYRSSFKKRIRLLLFSS